MTISWLALALVLAAVFYAVLSAVCARMAFRKTSARSSWLPPVSILKPLCGEEPELYENLKSFFQLDYPDYQLVFGLSESADGVALIRRLMQEFPDRPVAINIDNRINGSNPKISKIINMFGEARHEILVMADSDIRVAPDYLKQIVAPLADPAVGGVTCLYVGRNAQDSLVNRLARLHIDEWFLPSVMVARLLGQRDFCLGASVALRRDSLSAIGGFDALKNLLADDFMIGRLLAQRGYKVALAPCIVETMVDEAGFRTLVAHEIRWARTIRTVRPFSFALSLLMFTSPVCFLAGAMLLLPPASNLSLAIATMSAGPLLRMLLHMLRQDRRNPFYRDVWLVPVREFLSFGIWIASLAGSSVIWRGERMIVDSRGELSPAVTGARQ